MLVKFQEIQNNLLLYINQGDNIEENFQNFIDFFDPKSNDKYLILVLHLISQISNFHHKERDSIAKIEKILLFFKEEIKQKYINSVIYNIFKNNKRILLFLIKNEIITVDKYIAQQMMKKAYKKMRYPQYFFPELKPLFPFIKEICEDKIHSFWDTKENENEIFNEFKIEYSEQLPENFEEKREKGENDDYISRIIREDQIDDFITYFKKNDILIDSGIKLSIYETNSFILKKSQTIINEHIDFQKKSDCFPFTLNKEEIYKPSLIEYAAFYGSIQIFKYLQMNGAKVEPSIWIYAVHSDNPELIHFLEDIKISPEKDSFEKVFYESIKCHHNEIANYIKEHYLKNDENIEKVTNIKALKYFNFAFLSENLELFLLQLVKYDYYPFVEEIIKTKNIDINCLIKSELKDDGQFNAVKELKEERTLLHAAIENDNYDLVKLFLSDKNIDVNIEGYIQKLHSYSSIDKEWNDWEKWDDFVTKKITPLVLAIEKGNNDIIKLLLSDERIDINKKCEFFRRLLDEESVDNAFISPFYCAILHENIDILKILLSNENLDHDSIINFTYYDADGNGRSIYKICRTPFHLAVEIGNIEIIKLLIECGKIDVNSKKSYFSFRDEHEEWSMCTTKVIYTPFHIAIKLRNIDVVKLLLSYDCVDVKSYCYDEKGSVMFDDCDAWDDNRIKSIDDTFHISSKNHISTYEYEIFKKYPIHLAIESKNVDIIKFLLANEKIDVNIPADIDIQNYFIENDSQDGYDEYVVGKLPTFSFAIDKGNDEIVDILLSNDRIDFLEKYKFTSQKCPFEENKDEENSDKIHEVSMVSYVYSRMKKGPHEKLENYVKKVFSKMQLQKES